MFVCFKMFACLCSLPGRAPSERGGSGWRCPRCVGTVGSCGTGLPGESLTPARRHPGRCHGSLSVQRFYSRSGEVLRSYALEVGERREVAGFPRVGDGGGNRGREGEQGAAGCSPVPGRSRRRDPGRPQPARLPSPAGPRELEPRPAPRCVQLRPGSRGYQLIPRVRHQDRSGRRDVSGTHSPCCVGFCRRRDAPGPAWVRLGSPPAPAAHRFPFTPLPSQFLHRHYPSKKLMPSSPSKTKKGMDAESSAWGPRRVQPPPCRAGPGRGQRRGGPCAASGALQRGPGPVTNSR